MVGDIRIAPLYEEGLWIGSCKCRDGHWRSGIRYVEDRERVARVIGDIRIAALNINRIWTKTDCRRRDSHRCGGVGDIEDRKIIATVVSNICITPLHIDALCT